jgi:glycosyltransferase involved in cell wall biosynthesis
MPAVMRHILILNSGVGPSDPHRITTTLADGLPRDRFRVTVESVPAGRRFDPRSWSEFRRTVASADPNVLHAIGPGAVRAAAVLRRLSRGKRPAVIATAINMVEPGVAGWLTRLALRSADRVTVRTPAEADRFRALGVTPERLVVIPPAVLPIAEPLDPVRFRRELDIPETGRLVVAAGQFDGPVGLKSAAWAFDIVKYAHPDLYLVVVGDGPDRRGVERFSRGLGQDDYRVRFAGVRADLPAVFGLADVAWVLYEWGGVQTALEALIAGVPVVAVHTPDLAAIVETGVSGRLVPPADRVRLAALTHDLLTAPADARKLADAGRVRAAEFTPGRLLERFAALYDDLTPPRS